VLDRLLCSVERQKLKVEYFEEKLHLYKITGFSRHIERKITGSQNLSWILIL